MQWHACEIPGTEANISPKPMTDILSERRQTTALAL